MIPLPAMYAVICSVLWAGTAVVAKLLSVAKIPSVSFVFLRYVIASACLFPFISKADYRSINARQLPTLLLLGFTGVLLYNVIFFVALQYTSPTTLILILATHPVITLLATSIIFGLMPNKHKLCAFVLSFAGVAMVITQGDLVKFSLSGSMGEKLMFCGVLIQVVYTMTLKRVSGLFSPQFLTFATGVSGLGFLFPLILHQDLIGLVHGLSLFNWMLMAFIGIFGTAVAIIFYSMAITEMGAVMTSLIVFSTMPIFVFLLSFFILGDSISIWQGGGGFMVLLGLLIGLRAS